MPNVTFVAAGRSEMPPLPHADRRALSEAWFSALYSSRNPTPVRRSQAVSANATRLAGTHAPVAGNAGAAFAASCRLLPKAKYRVMPACIEARPQRPVIAKRFAAARLSVPASERGAGSTRRVVIALPDASRIALWVHHDGAGLRILALGSGASRPALALALHGAVTALARIGLPSRATARSLERS